MPSDRHKALYDDCLSRGVCPKCRKEDSATGKTMCPTCIAKKHVYNAKVRHGPQKANAVARKLGLSATIKPTSKPPKSAKLKRRKGRGKR